jgi:endonuclease G
MRNLIFVFLIISRFSFSQTYSLNRITATFTNDIHFVKHTFYEIGFENKYHLPAYTFYSLTREHLQLANLDRKGSFVKDPELNFPQAKGKDYSASGFDKGHMVPCEDMSFSETAMKETFYYSNCAPQTTELNRGEWKVLEELARTWGKEYGEVVVISGPVFEPNLQTMGEDRIPIPKLFYKIILRHELQTYKTIAFLMPNSSSALSELKNYVCNVDSVEKITGLDFFYDLPDNIEAQFESIYILNDWDFSHHVKTKNETDTIKTIPTQCIAKTKKGTRCKKMATSSNSLCNLHSK